MRVLFCSTGGIGHIRPMRPLAQALRDEGHTLAWVTAPDALTSLTDLDIALFPAGMDFPSSRRQFVLRHPLAQHLAGERRSEYTFPRLFGATLAPSMLDEVIATIDRWQPDLVVSDPAALAAPTACGLRGVRIVTHDYGLPLPPALLETAVRSFDEAISARGLRVPGARASWRELAIAIAPASLLEGSLRAPSNALALNAYPLQFQASQALPDDLRVALSGTTRPRVYLSFGTVFQREPALARAMHALIALGAELVVTAAAEEPIAHLRSDCTHLHLRAFVDQGALLPHCDLMVSHGGAGGVLGAAAHGLPHLVLPQAADHFRNARALAGQGAGAFLDTPDQTVDHIRGAAERLLSRGPHTAAAMRLATEMARMPPAAQAARALMQLTDERGDEARAGD